MSKYRQAYTPESVSNSLNGYTPVVALTMRSANDVAKEFGLQATTVAAWVGLSSTGMPAPALPLIAQANCGANKGADGGNIGRPKWHFKQPRNH